jgi:DNA-binding MarR family transcriptional regulator
VAAGDRDLPRLSYVVGRLDRALRQELDRRLEPFGLRWPEYTALSILRRTTGLSNAQLARRTYVTPQSMIEVISQLERERYLERAPSADNARILKSRVTRKGRRALAACDEAVDEMERTMLAGVPEERRAELVEQLIGCVQALHAGFADRSVR